MAKLYFYYASMNAGKSTTLLQADFNYRERGMTTMLFTAAIDDRFAKDMVTSRIGLEAGGNGAELRKLCEAAGGQATLVKADEDTRQRIATFTPELPVRRALTKSVKAAFDPLGIFNPGRMWKAV